MEKKKKGAPYLDWKGNTLSNDLFLLSTNGQRILHASSSDVGNFYRYVESVLRYFLCSKHFEDEKN